MLKRIEEMYWIDIELHNNTGLPQTTLIPRGTTFEVNDPMLSEQSLVVANDTSVTIPPGRHTVKLPAYCLNADLSSPRQAPGRLTPLRMVASFDSQRDVWNIVSDSQYQ